MSASIKLYPHSEQLAPAVNWKIIDAKELARRLSLPPTWVLEQTRSRAINPIPCLRFGRYVRFEWGSPELTKWMHDRHVRGGK